MKATKQDLDSWLDDDDDDDDDDVETTKATDVKPTASEVKQEKGSKKAYEKSIDFTV